MIERYTRPEMGRIWSPQNKTQKWLDVEIAVCEAWADQGVVPREAIDKIRRASFDLQRMAEYERETHHDMTAFLRSVADSLGEEARVVPRQPPRRAEAKQGVAVGKVSGPVGTHATVPPTVEEAVCRHLGLAVGPLSNQIVQRDRHAYFIATLAVIAASLEKFATEIRHLQRTEVAEVAEPFAAGQTGSSAMPHKRNPEKCERVSGLARLIRGYAVIALENVALWHERDLSNSAPERVILPDSCIILDYILDMFTFIMRGLEVYPERMRENLEAGQGVVFSQRVLLALIDKGLGREDGYQPAHRN